jgi:hypothetical protein
MWLLRIVGTCGVLYLCAGCALFEQNELGQTPIVEGLAAAGQEAVKKLPEALAGGPMGWVMGGISTIAAGVGATVLSLRGKKKATGILSGKLGKVSGYVSILSNAFERVKQITGIDKKAVSQAIDDEFAIARASERKSLREEIEAAGITTGRTSAPD